MNTFLHKIRDEKPLCRVCGIVCKPDEHPVAILLIGLDDHGDRYGMIPVHAGRCEAEARDRLRDAQARVAN